MNEQTILLISLIMALGIILWLYIIKTQKQIKYKGDERWKQIQIKANNAADFANWILILLLAILPLFINSQMTFSFQQVTIFGFIYIGVRNLIELAATIYLDRNL